MTLQTNHTTNADIEKIRLYTDGGSRGNPGVAGFGFVIYLDTTSGAEIVLKKCGNYIGETTNNQAEYRGIISGLEWLIDNGYSSHSLEIYMDSLLVVNQLNGKFKVKNKGLRPLWQKARNLLSRFDKYTIQHVYRSENSEADELANMAMDMKQKIEE